MDTVEQANSQTAAICAVAELGPDAMALLLPDQKPPDFVAALVDQQLYPDAVRFLAHALPKREAVWWGWISARRAAGEHPPPKIKAALEATERWIAQPTEENRRAAHAAAEHAQFGTAAGCAGLGAFFSSGSLAPPEAPVVPPGDYLTAKAISGAVNFAAMGGEPREAPEKFRSFIAQGVDVARRIKLWEGK
ncbi:putative secreted protein [Candidatus Sulfopaludibacter sp. SbA4]|nr:putative secreted protein [Candidatus Sulfopaludibacter sp. SbA4]